jgi:integrase
LREGELLGLKWADYDEENKVLHVRRNLVIAKDRNADSTRNYKIIEQDNLKTSGSKRTIPLSPEAINTFNEIKKMRKNTKARGFYYLFTEWYCLEAELFTTDV